MEKMRLSKEEYIHILDSAFKNGIPFINYLEYYSYALILQGNGNWLEASYDFEEHAILDSAELPSADALANFSEELEKAMKDAVEIFYLNKWKDFKQTLTGTDGEKLQKSIEELVKHAEIYSDNLPIVRSPEDIQKIKALL